MPGPGSPTASLWSDYEDPTKAPGESPLRPEAIARRAERPPERPSSRSSRSSRHSESPSSRQSERPPARQSNHRTPLSPITESSFSSHTQGSRTERGAHQYEDPYFDYQQQHESYPPSSHHEIPQYRRPAGRYSHETHTEYPSSHPLPPQVIPCNNPHHPSGPHRHRQPEQSSRSHHESSHSRSRDRDTNRSSDRSRHHSSHGHRTGHEPSVHTESTTRPTRQAVLIPLIVNDDGTVRPGRPGEGFVAPEPLRLRRNSSPSAPPRRRSSSRRH